MFYIKWGFRILFALLVISFLHYTLPQYDVVRIADTEVLRQEVGESPLFWAQPDTGQAATSNRDVRFINARRPNGSVIVYRNEDTGWGWPPYFKLDSSNLQAEASDLVSTQSDPQPQWVAIKHYGWRSEFLSIYPNAVRIRPVDGPNTRVIPWSAIVILVLLFAAFWAIYVRWRRFWAKRIDPVVEGVVDTWESFDDDVGERRGLFRRISDFITGRNRKA